VLELGIWNLEFPTHSVVLAFEDEDENEDEDDRIPSGVFDYVNEGRI
jgi:hypothetical protein